MAKVKKVSYPGSPTASRGNGYKYSEFFNSFNCPLMSAHREASNKCVLEIDNTLTLTFDMELASAQSSTYCSLLVTYNGTTTKYSGRCNPSRGLNILCACSDIFVYINHWDSWGNRVEIVYDIVNSDCKFCGWKDWGTNSYTIRSVNFNSVQTGIVYTLASRLNTTTESGQIAFAPAILKRSGIKSLVDPNFICCTQVTTQQKLTMADGSKYFSIDPYILVPYEEEE